MKSFESDIVTCPSHSNEVFPIKTCQILEFPGKLSKLSTPRLGPHQLSTVLGVEPRHRDIAEFPTTFQRTVTAKDQCPKNPFPLPLGPGWLPSLSQSPPSPLPAPHAKSQQIIHISPKCPYNKPIQASSNRVSVCEWNRKY